MFAFALANIPVIMQTIVDGRLPGCFAVAIDRLEHAAAMEAAELESGEAGETERVVTHQLREGVSQTPNLISADFLLAYEPVWAIGTGLTASAGDASAIHTVLR